jgi:microcystin-dependent protein
MIDQAVTDGYLTQAQADALKANTFGLGRGGHFGGLYDEDQYLADALGISTEDLQAAELEAHAAQLAAAVEAGYLTQEQADIMLARRAAESYLDRDGLQAQMTAAYEAAIAAAVADGAITQAQADALLAQMAAQPWGFGGRGGRGGHGGMRGFGGFDGLTPAPSTAPDTDTNTNTSTGQDA